MKRCHQCDGIGRYAVKRYGHDGSLFAIAVIRCSCIAGTLYNTPRLTTTRSRK